MEQNPIPARIIILLSYETNHRFACFYYLVELQLFSDFI